MEYRHLRENQILRDAGISVVPIARQTKQVSGSQANGSGDAQANAEDLIDTFGADYLAGMGGQFRMFLDVEGALSRRRAGDRDRARGRTVTDALLLDTHIVLAAISACAPDARR